MLPALRSSAVVIVQPLLGDAVAGPPVLSNRQYSTMLSTRSRDQSVRTEPNAMSEPLAERCLYIYFLHVWYSRAIIHAGIQYISYLLPVELVSQDEIRLCLVALHLGTPLPCRCVHRRKERLC